MEGEGQGDFTTSEGAGLADGQGAKDVSDQVNPSPPSTPLVNLLCLCVHLSR